ILLSCSGQKTLESVKDDGANPFGATLPEGFVVEEATPPGMVSYPMFATFDLDGRLFVIESSGKTTSTEDVLANPTFQILLLQDENTDGVFDKRQVFADKIPYPMGGTFYQGSFYVTAPPDLLRFTDTDADGIADKREVLLTGWTLNHNAATLSGPFFGPDGWMYMCDARRGFDITTQEGTRLKGKGARIWRCRPDGSGLEWISGGGFDNTIEMIFMPSGETIGTMTYFTDPQDGFRDALMHWVEGGVYPKPYPVIEEDRLKLTGDLMPVMTKLARVSHAGLMRYRGSSFGSEYKGNLFSAQFNTGRIMRHVITPDGATFSTAEEPFLKWDNLERHPTDVLEDADGSLLVVNTGGWFIAGCPLSVVAKTDVHGGIFRIRKRDARATSDPWGKHLEFETMAPEQLTALMSDDRPVVRDKAIEQLVRIGDGAVGSLEDILSSPGTDEVRASAVFALYRIQRSKAMESVLAALDDQSAVVRTSAARSVGLAKDSRAVDKLSRMLSDGSLPVRRQAATALGQIGDGKAIGALIAAAAKPSDRFVEHAITHALIVLGKPGPLLAALKDPSEDVRKTALIALDQIDGSPLRKEHLKGFLDSRNTSLQKSAVWVVSHHPEWSDMVVSYLNSVFNKPRFPEEEKQAVRDLLMSFSGNGMVRDFVGSQLTDQKVTMERKLFLLDIMKQSAGSEFPDAWVQVMGALLRGKDRAMQSAVLDVIQSQAIGALDGDLRQIFRDPEIPQELRVKAMRARLRSQQDLSDEDFDSILDLIAPERSPYVRQTAVALLVQADLTEGQLQILAKEYLPDADIFLLPALVSSFEGSKSETAGNALVTALSAAPERLDHLSMDALQKLFNTFPASVAKSAEPLLNALREQQASRLSALEKMESSLGIGDVGTGRKLFFGKALCSTCHAVSGNGAQFGPDLTNIGEIRSRHDILEAILYPSASFAREYETSNVVTPNASYAGIIKQQLPEAMVIETGPGVTMRLARSEISAIEPARVSLMPPGLHNQLTAQEMSDLMAYLSTLPDGLGHLKTKALK
ncbi:MAG: PVC-type heme-binding CxxCH protein, partial [Chryseosolibacter sp.]